MCATPAQNAMDNLPYALALGARDVFSDSSDPINTNTGIAKTSQGQSLGSFVASATGGVVAAAIQILIFLLIKDRFPRI